MAALGGRNHSLSHSSIILVRHRELTVYSSCWVETGVGCEGSIGGFFLLLNVFLPPFSPQFRGIHLLAVTILSHRYNSRTGSGETMVESHASSETQPNQAALLLDTMPIQPGSQLHQCVGGNTVHLATWSACTAPGPPQESLERDETRISLGQLCVAPRTGRSRPGTTEPGRKPRGYDGTAGAAVQRP